MADKYIIPSRFTDEDILYMFESLMEVTAMIDLYQTGDTELAEIESISDSIRDKLNDIGGRVSINSFFAH